LYDLKKPLKPTNDLDTIDKANISAIAGGIATIFSHPFDKANIL